MPNNNKNKLFLIFHFVFILNKKQKNLLIEKLRSTSYESWHKSDLFISLTGAVSRCLLNLNNETKEQMGCGVFLGNTLFLFFLINGLFCLFRLT